MRPSTSMRLWANQALVHCCGQTLQRVSGNYCRHPRRTKLDTGIVSRRTSIKEVSQNSRLSCRFRPIVSARHGTSSVGNGGPAVEAKEDVSDTTVQAAFPWAWSGVRRHMSRDARGKREDDEGDWKYSPEWWGTQGNGWGHNEGELVFTMPSVMGNGVVSVTAHPAATPKSSNLQIPLKGTQEEFGQDSNALYKLLGYEWRVLRFNNFTRQSVAKVKAVATRLGDIILLQQPNCIAFEYTKSMISSGLAAVSLSGLDLQGVQNGSQKMRILCIGMGGGSLPLFLAHNLPGATVEVVEIDPAVISAAVQTMGFPPFAINSHNAASYFAGVVSKDAAALWGEILQRIIVDENDGEAFVCEQARRMADNEAFSHYDLVFVDAYDGLDVVPPELCDSSGPFLRSLSKVLHADHGTVVVNLHTDSAPPTVFERISGKFGPGFDPALPQGQRVQETAHAYRDVLLNEIEFQHVQDSKEDAKRSATGQLAFTVAVSLQGNISLVVSRGALRQPGMSSIISDEKVNTEEALVQALVGEANKVQDMLNISFDLSKRVSRGFQSVKSKQELGVRSVA